MNLKQLLFNHGPISLFLSISAIAPSLATTPVTTESTPVITEFSAATLEGTQSSAEFSQSGSPTVDDDVDNSQPLPEAEPATEVDSKNCQNFLRSSVPADRSMAIIVTPMSEINFSPTINSQPVLLKLAFPLPLTENCILGNDQPHVITQNTTDNTQNTTDTTQNTTVITQDTTLVEAQLITERDGKGFKIIMEALMVNGYRLPLNATSQVIPFTRDAREADEIPQNDNGFCQLSRFLPGLFLEPNDVSPFNLSDVSNAAVGACTTLSRGLSYTLGSTLSQGDVYSLRVDTNTTQRIDIPIALQAQPEAEQLLERLQNVQSAPQNATIPQPHNATIPHTPSAMESALSARD